jgi:hypothetical protein
MTLTLKAGGRKFERQSIGIVIHQTLPMTRWLSPGQSDAARSDVPGDATTVGKGATMEAGWRSQSTTVEQIEITAVRPGVQ